MPAIGCLGYVFNEGVEGRDIFCDRADYEIFLSYLKDSLSVAADPENLKKTFVVKGRSFRGLPRQPKNFLNRVELLAYRLRRGCFHLLVHEFTPGFLEQFMRSLLTRYSIYYNKKYKRSGSLFSGSYRVFKPSSSQAIFLSYFLHRGSLDCQPDSVLKSFSSYAEYLGLRRSLWVNTDLLLSSFKEDEKENFKGVSSYQEFVEKYELNQEEKKVLESILFEKVVGEKVLNRISDEVIVSERRSIDDKTKKRPVPWQGMPAFLTSTILFLVLFGLGVRNIRATQGQKLAVDELTAVTETVLSAATSEATGPTAMVDSPEISPADSPASGSSELDDTPSMVLRVKVIEGLSLVNIRRGPAAESEKIGSAQSGDVFEFVSENQDWYEIKMADGTVGFVAAAYTELFTQAKEGTD